MIGEVIAGRYRITARIGSGGTGEVYEAEDLELPRKAAIKVLSPVWGDDERLRQRFLREAEALSLVDHPHVCTIYKAGETDSGKLFIAMAYYEGEHLRARLAHGDLPVVESVATALAIAEGMDKAHRKGVLHRDLKPENIVFTEDGVVKILDFGLAKISDRTQMTETGVTMGTLAYTSPEQIRGEDLDGRSDIYSLGVLFYQMVTGVAPFAAGNAAETIQLVLTSKPDRPSKLREGVPDRLEKLILACMSREAEARPSTMAVIQDELVTILTEISPSAASRHRAIQVDTTLVGPEHPRSRSYQVPLLIVLTIALIATQFPRLRAMLDMQSTPNDPGIAVLPIQPERASEELSLLADGIWQDILDQAIRLSEFRDGWWVLPTYYSERVSAENARARFGVSTTLGGTLRNEGEFLIISLELVETNKQLTLASGSWRLPDEELAIARWLASALEIPLSPEQLDQLKASLPRSNEALRRYLRGRGLRFVGQDAVPALTRAADLEPRSADALLQLSAALVDRGDSLSLAKSESLLTDAEYPTALQAERHATLSRVFQIRADYEGAARELDEAINANPSNPEWYRAGIRENPGYLSSHELLAYFYLRMDRYSEAIGAYQRVTELVPAHPNGWNSLGACYYALEDWDNATLAFETSFEIEQNHAACSNLGTLYYMEGRFEDAAGMYEWAWEQDQTDHRVLGNRAAALRWVPGREDEVRQLSIQAAEVARQQFEEGPDDNPPLTLAYLAGYLLKIDPEQTREHLEQALLMAPEDPEVLYRAAVIYEELGERPRALTLLGSAIDLGHPLLEVNNERLLDDLRQDPRFRLLLP
jgi:serine/threonine-protein kinase